MSFHHCTKAAARGAGPQPTQTNEFDSRAAGPLLVFAVDSPPCAVPCHGPPVEAAMRSCRILVAVIALLLAPSMAVARGGGGGHGGGGHGGSHSIVTSPVTIPSRPPAGSGQITCSRERSDDVLSTANRRGGLTRIIGGGRVGRRPTHRVGFRLGSRRRTGPWANAR